MAEQLLTRFRKLLRDTGLLPTHSRVLVAVSGGADSVALLRLLHAVAKEFSLQLVVAHLDHGLRPESGDDAFYVRQLAKQLGLPLVSRKIEKPADLPAGSGGPEERARTARRGFLEQTAANQKCRFIALAHHQDDQAETFLLNLLRGAGPLGLAGMRRSEPPYVRPLLGFRRDELKEYLVEQQLDWREDASNRDTRFTRNRIRHELLPQLASYNPRISSHLARLCEFLAADEECWGGLIRDELQGMAKYDGDGLSVPCTCLQSLPEAFSARLLRAALEDVRGDLRRITSTHIRAIQNLLAGNSPQAELNLPGAWVGRRYDQLLIRPNAPDISPWPPVEIIGPGEYLLPDARTLHVTVEPEPQGEGHDVVEFPCAQINFPMVIRTVLPGDRFSPSGMSGTCKLQDFFVDRKLTREQRATQPLIVKGGKILWLVGLRRCADFHHQSGAVSAVIRLQVRSE